MCGLAGEMRGAVLAFREDLPAREKEHDMSVGPGRLRWEVVLEHSRNY